jgi:predicted Zn-dependent protease
MKPLAYLMLLAVPALNAQQSPAGAAGRGVNFYSIEKEAALGAQLASEFQRQNKILDNDQVNGYLNSVGGRLLKQIPETGFTFRLAAFADSEKSGVHEPRVLPGAHIYVPESLILAVKNEAEFAGMLAHAIAHSANRDATRQASRAELVQIGTIPLWMSDAAAPSAGNRMPIGILQLQRGYEREADDRAAPMMAGAGWDPKALVGYIEREQPSAYTVTAAVFSALPPLEERIADLRKSIGNLAPRDYSTSAEFAAIQAEVRRLNSDQVPRTPSPTLAPPQE